MFEIITTDGGGGGATDLTSEFADRLGENRAGSLFAHFFREGAKQRRDRGGFNLALVEQWQRRHFVTIVPMKQLTIVVKPFKAAAVLEAIASLGVTACSVREAKGYGRQKGYLDRYRGSEYSTAYLPKVEITVWVTDEQAAELMEKVPRAARTGRIGDGKLFVVPTAWPEALEF